jgi:hypothetical protein
MTQKTTKTVIGGVICALIALIIIRTSGIVGVSANKVERDARKAHKISNAWEISQAINYNLCAMIFYNEALDDHTFSIYVNRNGFSFGYFFRAGGTNGAVANGINGFTFDIYGLALISMNTDNVARIELDNDIEVTRIDVNPARPFAVVIPMNCGSVMLYDVNENIVPITVIQG